MIIVHGGKSQGQEAFAEELYNQLLEIKAKGESLSKMPLIIGDYYEQSKRKFLESGDMLFEIEELQKEHELILVTLEIGNGIVPLDAAERAFRDHYGRELIELSKRADRVYRMICGIPQQIK